MSGCVKPSDATPPAQARLEELERAVAAGELAPGAAVDRLLAPG